MQKLKGKCLYIGQSVYPINIDNNTWCELFFFNFLIHLHTYKYTILLISLSLSLSLC